MGIKKIRLSSVHIYGAVYRVGRNTVYWNVAKRIAKEISVSHQHVMGSPARYVRLLKAKYYSVKGLVFIITFRVKREDGASVAYTAEVWNNICKGPIKVFSFDKVPGSERIPKDWEIGGSNYSDKKISTKKMGKKGLDLFKGLSSAIPMTTYSEFDCGEQIRSQRSWNYSRARKCASTIWQGLPESEKMIFLSEAAKRSN